MGPTTRSGKTSKAEDSNLSEGDNSLKKNKLDAGSNLTAQCNTKKNNNKCRAKGIQKEQGLKDADNVKFTSEAGAPQLVLSTECSEAKASQIQVVVIPKKKLGKAIQKEKENCPNQPGIAQETSPTSDPVVNVGGDALKASPATAISSDVNSLSALDDSDKKDKNMILLSGNPLTDESIPKTNLISQSPDIAKQIGEATLNETSSLLEGEKKGSSLNEASCIGQSLAVASKLKENETDLIADEAPLISSSSQLNIEIQSKDCKNYSFQNNECRESFPDQKVNESRNQVENDTSKVPKVSSFENLEVKNSFKVETENKSIVSQSLLLEKDANRKFDNDPIVIEDDPIVIEDDSPVNDHSETYGYAGGSNDVFLKAEEKESDKSQPFIGPVMEAKHNNKNFMSQKIEKISKTMKNSKRLLHENKPTSYNNEIPQIASTTLKKDVESKSPVPKSISSNNKVNKIVKKEAPKVEFISVYSSEEVKKKPLEVSKGAVKEQEPPKAQIGHLQPVLKLVDPAELDRETENYYKEVGALPKAPQPDKPKCLTPKQIASITKEYPPVNSTIDRPEDSEKVQAAWTLMHQYWTFVQENPYDFDGWTSLLNHVETMNNIEAARSAFEGFLPLYPYCFAYWLKFSDLELKFSDLEQSLGVLYLGTKCVPFCTDLWVPLLNKFMEYASKENISEDVVRGVYEFALDSLGLSWQSSPIWDVCINYETSKGDLVRVMNLYRRLLTIPTKLYNKHWDHLLALVRDYHPRNLLTIEEYSNLKKSACDILKIKFNPPTLEAPTTLLKVTQPEDPIHTTIKEKIVASLIPIHEVNEGECNRRWKYEEKIKRPYFHVKPLERKQLKTWREYLDFEIKNGDPVRIVMLFERCLVPCAMYEEFWCKYASFMEDHVLNVMKKKYENVDYKPGCFSKKGSDENGESDKSTLMNGEKSKKDEKDDKPSASDSVENLEMSPDFWNASLKKLQVSPETKFEVTFLLNRLCEDIGVGNRVLTPPSLTPSSILRGLTWEDVRQIYRRGAWIHCPNKPLILMQWAEFEEGQECVQTARELLNTVLAKHPKLLKARIQLIELERRNDQLDRVEELYAQTFATFTETRIRSCIAIRYARFLFKIREEDDKALLILRKALKKDKGNIHLYHHVFDVCYQRRPIDCNGVLASVMLALASKELTLDQKYLFCVKRSEFLREHGSMAQLKEAKAEMEELKLKLDKEQSMTNTNEQTKDADIKNESSDKINEANDITQNSIDTSVKHDQSGASEAVGKMQSSSANNTNEAMTENVNEKDSPLISLQHPPMPPILEPVKEKESKSERSERRRRREESSGHRSKRKSSRSSSKKERKSKRERRSDGRHHRRDREEGEMRDSDEEEEGELCESNENLLTANAITIDNGEGEINVPPSITQILSELLPSQVSIRPPENKPYSAVPPSWDLNVPALSSYGYGKSSDLVKQGQNSLYERYYELIKQGYEAKERERNAQATNLSREEMGQDGNNSYLPPPPMPQGILGESLFNQGKMENLHNLDGNQGHLPTEQFSMPTSASNLGPEFASRLPPQQEMNAIKQPQQGVTPHHIGNTPVAGNVVESMGIRVPNVPPPINPTLHQTNNPPPKFSRGLLEPPTKIGRTDTLPPVNQDQVNVPQRTQGLLGDFPSPVSKSHERERESRGNRGGRGRDRNRSHPAPFNPQSTHESSRPPPYMNLNSSRELSFESGKGGPIVNIPEWLVKEGGELRLSDTNNGESFIRYWPRYMNEDGHKTLFHSLRKSVKWYQRRQLVGLPSENNWINLPKLISWIGPCNYEKDGIILNANTAWPPEVVDLLHRLIHFSNSSFNSCLMSLYSSGYSHHPWHSEAHEAMSKNPTTACISLGVTRTIEMKRIDGSGFVRFPLFPGSLFVMEGATHTDWLCQIPKEQVSGERISLSFRTMLMIKGITV